jgi:hypothetical protein
LEQLRKENVYVSNALKLDSVALSTGAMEDDLSVTARIEMRGAQHVVDKVRSLIRSSGATSSYTHSVDDTLAGKILIERVLTKLTDLSTVRFPESWELDVDVQEQWPRRANEVVLDLNGGQDPDAVALLLRSIGVAHDYD